MTSQPNTVDSIDPRHDTLALWLDDIRPLPDEDSHLVWLHARSVNEAITLLQHATFAVASLDHDLGDYAYDGGDGYHLVDWMVEHDIWPTDSIHVHSANPIGVQRMLGTIDRYGPYRQARNPQQRFRTMLPVSSTRSKEASS